MQQLWRSRRWRLLLNLIDHLPPDSFYVEALSLDKDAAAAALDAEVRGKTAQYRGPRLSDYSPVSARLDNILDRLGELIQATAASKGAKARKMQRTQRPRTAMDDVKLERGRAQHQRLTAQLIPGGELPD